MIDKQKPISWLREAPGTVVVCALIGLFTFTTVLSRRYLDLQTTRAQRFFRRGQQLDRSGQTAQAVEQYRNALAISRGNREYTMAVAVDLMREGFTGEAELYFEELLRDRPADALANLMLARIAMKRGQTDTAIDYYNRAIYGRWPADTDESRIRTRWELVDALRKTNRHPELVAELLQISSDEPDNQEDRTKAAEMLLQAGAADQASKLFRELLQEGARTRPVYAGYGESLLATGDYLGARNALTRAWAADPSDQAVHDKLTLVESALALNPLARDASVTERYTRSRALLERVIAAMKSCGATAPPPPAADQLAKAEQSLTARSGFRNLQEVTDQHVSMAEQLWNARRDFCGNAVPGDDALQLAMRQLSHQ